MKLLFGSVTRVRILRRENINRSRRIFAGSQSHQPFRSIHHFVGGQTKNRLDGDGRIFSVRGREISVARGRCVPGRSRSCRSQNYPDRNRATERRDAWSVFFPRAGFAMARDRCSKAHRCGPARQHWHTLPAFRFCPALSLAAIASIRLDAGCRFGARPSGSRSAIQSRIFLILKDHRRASGSNPNWRLHSKISTRTCDKYFA